MGDYPGETSLITRLLIRERGRPVLQGSRYEDATLLIWKAEEGAMRQGKWAVLRSWKRREGVLLWNLQKKFNLANITDWSPDHHFRLFTSNNVREKNLYCQIYDNLLEQ